MGRKSKISAPSSDEPSPDSYHIPVLLNETIEGLQIKPNGIYVDCTFGGGGHSRVILSKLDAHGKLVAFDQDADARRNLPDDRRVIFEPHNFRHIGRFLRLHKIAAVDGILADLGVSSHQFDEAERGFSIRQDADLDMRMNQQQELTAAKLIATYSEAALHKMFEQYGEVTNAKTLARTIVEKRGSAPIQTIQAFRQAIQSVVKGNPNKYLAQVFQALRIAVNDELGALKEMLQQIPPLLRPEGRVAIISFHSLEDRIVKNFFRQGSIDPLPVDEIYGGRQESSLQVITTRPIEPGEEELKKNPRSRSARLRIAAKK